MPYVSPMNTFHMYTSQFNNETIAKPILRTLHVGKNKRILTTVGDSILVKPEKIASFAHGMIDYTPPSG
jgi:hypothetical protein